MPDEGFKITNSLNLNEKKGRIDNVGTYYLLEVYAPQTIKLDFWSLRGGKKSTTIIVKESK